MEENVSETLMETVLWELVLEISPLKFLGLGHSMLLWVEEPNDPTVRRAATRLGNLTQTTVMLVPPGFH